MARSCSVVFDEHCTAVPGMAPDEASSTRASCAACGLAACTSCTTVTVWFGQARTRVCTSCLQDAGRGREVAELVWARACYRGEVPADLLAAYGAAAA